MNWKWYRKSTTAGKSERSLQITNTWLASGYPLYPRSLYSCSSLWSFNLVVKWVLFNMVVIRVLFNMVVKCGPLCVFQARRRQREHRLEDLHGAMYTWHLATAMHSGSSAPPPRSVLVWCFLSGEAGQNFPLKQRMNWFSLAVRAVIRLATHSNSDPSAGLLLNSHVHLPPAPFYSFNGTILPVSSNIVHMRNIFTLFPEDLWKITSQA